jgi:hypothetical protein
MQVIKFDVYDYDIQYHNPGPGSDAVLYLLMEDTLDVSIFDVASDLSNSNRVYVDGRYFLCLDYAVEPFNERLGSTTMKLYLSSLQKGEALKNENKVQ